MSLELQCQSHDNKKWRIEHHFLNQIILQESQRLRQKGKRIYGSSNTPPKSLIDSIRGQFICNLRIGSAWLKIYIFQYNTRGTGGSDRASRSTEDSKEDSSRSRCYFLSLLDCRLPVSWGSTCYGRTCMNIKCRVTRGAFYRPPGDSSISYDRNGLLLVSTLSTTETKKPHD